MQIPRSIPNKEPLTNINFYNSVELAKKVNGVLLDKEDYNRVCMCLIETKAVTFEEVFLFGNDKGNYSKPFVKSKNGSSFFTGANYPPSIRWWATPEEGKENVGLRIVIRDDLED